MKKKNTRLHYMYCDGSNYKVGHECVIFGELKLEEIIKYMDTTMGDDPQFIASEVGLYSPQEEFKKKYAFPTDDDHVWCRMLDCEPTSSAPDKPVITAEQLRAAFKKAKWDEREAMVKLGWNPMTI
jgi:hypothetical protein